MPRLPFLLFSLTHITQQLDFFIILLLIFYFFVSFSVFTILLPLQLLFSHLHFSILFQSFAFIYLNSCFLIPLPLYLSIFLYFQYLSSYLVCLLLMGVISTSTLRSTIFFAQIWYSPFLTSIMLFGLRHAYWWFILLLVCYCSVFSLHCIFLWCFCWLPCYLLGSLHVCFSGRLFVFPWIIYSHLHLYLLLVAYVSCNLYALPFSSSCFSCRCLLLR